MNQATALPDADEAAASGADTAPIETDDQAQNTQQESDEAPETDGAEAKQELTPEQRELRRAERKINRLVRQREELRARLNQGLPNQPINGNNRDDYSDSERVTLTRAELQAQIEAQAIALAPKLQEQRGEAERRGAVIQSLAKEFGAERFDALAADLDDALGGLRDQRGMPKPAADAIFEAESPAAVIEYLADPENSDEAEAIGRMGAVQAGRAIGRLEARLADKAKQKTPISKAPAPLEAVRGRAGGARDYNTITDDAAWYEARRAARMKRAAN